ncbi:MAG TPA: lysophospholipid acyltransferase family protein [Thermoanaerobaculia bacterium]|nr:lysophospholipid acyltransferase family protein [Thermoanaerobaculia bacterium]
MQRLVRAISSATMRLVLRVFFRRIEIAGADHIPAAGPVIFVLNHPNGLMDPLFLLCFAPRPVFFLAKEPLFRMPVVGFFVRAFGSIPVYRRQDPGSDVARNRETFARARELLSRGSALALFPEGASHDQPRLLGLKTGAARIALGVVAGEGLRIVPAGLYYTWKSRFRSGALLSFGEPLAVVPVPLDDRGEPAPSSTQELTRRIESALSALTLQAESREALDLVRRAERIFSIEAESQEPLSGEFELRRRFLAGAALLQKRDPARFVALQARIARFEAERKEAGLPLEHLTPESLTVRSLARLALANLGSLLLLPLAALGAFLHYPAYRLVGYLANRFARGMEEPIATLKGGAAVLLFPATWGLCAAVAEAFFGRRAAIAAAILAPVSGYTALRAGESLDLLAGRSRALFYALSRRYSARRLLAERRAIHEEILRVAAELELLPGEAPAPSD